MDEDPSEILVVFFHTVIELFYFRLLQEPQHAFFQLSGTLTGNNFHQGDLFIDGFCYYPVELGIDGTAFIKNIM